MLPAVLLCVVAAVLVVCGGTAPAVGAPIPPPVGTAPTTQWGWPLDGPAQPAPQVARPFQPPPEPWAAGHRGVDLRGRPGQPVRAPAAGVITHAGPIAGRGVLVVRVGALRTTLEPVTPAVREGTRVRAGQVIGHLQSNGSHCLPDSCLHWGVLHGDDYRDPLPLVGAGSARIILLPTTGPPPAQRWPAAVLPAALRTADASREAVATAIAFAREQLGEPYVWAAAGPGAWDCSGLTMAAWSAAGTPLPHYSAAQYDATTPISEAQLRPGDLVFWSALPGMPDTIFHVGLYLGDGQMVHAPRPGTSVRVESIYSWAQPSFFGRV